MTPELLTTNLIKLCFYFKEFLVILFEEGVESIRNRWNKVIFLDRPSDSEGYEKSNELWGGKGVMQESRFLALDPLCFDLRRSDVKI